MTIFQKIVKANELPPEWAKQFGDPDARVEITIREVDEELAKAGTLEETMDLISRRAEARGLTPEILQDMLDER